MSTVVIDLAYGKGHLRGERMRVVGVPWNRNVDTEDQQEEVVRDVLLSQVEHIVMSPQVSLSGMLQQELLNRGVMVTIMGQCELLGSIRPARAAKGRLRLSQYRCACDADWCLRQARVIVATKIYNQAYMLKRRQNVPSDVFFREMKRLQKLTMGVEDIAELMGVEGRASALYFAEWGKSLPSAYPFLGRTRRPPKDAVNACLSYLSALCQGDMLRAVVESGLDENLGVLHSIQDYRHNLVLDLMEPFRPILVEGVVRDVLTHGMLDEDSTEMNVEDGGCYLTVQGRTMLIRRYEQRMLRRFLNGEKHTNLRRCMQHVSQDWKKAVMDLSYVASNYKLG